MSEIKRRRLGPGNLIVIFVLAAIAISMVVYALAGAKKNKELTQAQFEQYIYTYDVNGKIILSDPLVVNEIYFETTNHNELIKVTGTFKEEFKNAVGVIYFLIRFLV